MTNTPSKAEIEKLAAEHLKAFTQFGIGGQVWFEGEVEFARAVLAKWGKPQPENLGFTIENRAGADVVVWKEGGCRPATSAEIAMWKALSAAQQPVAREPLTDEQIKELIEDGVFLGNCKEIVRAIEHAHGITQKGGSNGL